MNRTKKIVFLSGTRADFGKIKPLIQSIQHKKYFETFIFVTGMHLIEKYGYTVLEIEKSGFTNIHKFENTTSEATMDLTLAKTIEGFSAFVKNEQPDLIVVHGDRVETLAGAIVGCLNNILVAHIEGGELSGTVDELLRHSVSKLSHIHLVSNEEAEKRLLQMGELSSSIKIIGSPDVDVMFSENLPTLQVVKKYYEIEFDTYAIAIFHPVTTELTHIEQYAKQFVEALKLSGKNYVVIYPNNDLGANLIIDQYNKITDNTQFRVLPSLRFEYFLTLLKNANFIVGNSSAGVREAPYYRIPTINIGTRQNNRAKSTTIINVDNRVENICNAIKQTDDLNLQKNEFAFGKGNSGALFLRLLQDTVIWNVSNQKIFREI